MKVIAVNGSSQTGGNTALALKTAMETLNAEGIQTDLIEIGRRPIHGCTGCGVCFEKENRRCVFTDDEVNGWLEKMFDADGILLGSPVYYAGINGALKSFLDRAFFVAAANGALFRHKVGAGIVAVRRAGSTSALEQMNKFFLISEMFMPSSTYWNMIYGLDPGEAAQDAEGMETVRVLAKNMAWLLKLIEHGRTAIPPPPFIDKTFTNFIR